VIAAPAPPAAAGIKETNSAHFLRHSHAAQYAHTAKHSSAYLSI
jgi:hypothetical protein